MNSKGDLNATLFKSLSLTQLIKVVNLSAGVWKQKSSTCVGRAAGHRHNRAAMLPSISGSSEKCFILDETQSVMSLISKPPVFKGHSGICNKLHVEESQHKYLNDADFKISHSYFCQDKVVSFYQMWCFSFRISSFLISSDSSDRITPKYVVRTIKNYNHEGTEVELGRNVINKKCPTCCRSGRDHNLKTLVIKSDWMNKLMANLIWARLKWIAVKLK